MLSTEQLPHVIKTLQSLMTTAGNELVPHHGQIPFTEKINTYDLLTEFDTSIEQRLRQALKNDYPDIPFVGEEHGGDYTAKEFWLVDPIDGTLHFVRGMPFSTLMVSLVQDGKPVLGALYNFSTKEFFSAYRGGGAFCNGKEIHVSTRTASEILLLTEINLAKGNNSELVKRLDQNYKLLNTCSAGYEFSLIANGSVEARLAKDPYGKAYDFCPGAIIVQEAGGVVKELSGADFTINSRDFIAAASEDIYQSIIVTLTTNSKDSME